MKEKTFGTLIILFIVFLFSWNLYLPKMISNDIAGTWRSNEEPKYTVTFDSFGNVVEGFEDNRTSGLYTINKYPINNFTLVTTFEEEFHYIISEVNKYELILIEVESNNTYSFSKVN